MQEFETRSVRMETMQLLRVQAPCEDVERIMRGVVAITPLVIGHYDSNAFQSSAGTERYRPLDGAAAGAEPGVRLRPGVVELSFELPCDRLLVEQVVETIFQLHSYQEPVIRLETILASRSKNLDDSANPNRWWNTTGDWMQRRPDRTAGT
ncbi:hypothetical protein [Rhizobium alvei]|uniref:Uncharacterized protein n=1 Tax=Rhizobium alvei TaxID=1132659 RepID=A0ABT8YHL0_9HYPH|nr:hypothetical protein [Rhizobium alvei]MDO6962740.1 hypothetical protein [Rhizobium alvei]